MTFLPLSFRCHSTTYGEPDIFNQPCENLALGELGKTGAGQLIIAPPPFLRCSPLKGSSSLQGPIILVMPISGFDSGLHEETCTNLKKEQHHNS